MAEEAEKDHPTARASMHSLVLDPESSDGFWVAGSLRLATPLPRFTKSWACHATGKLGGGEENLQYMHQSLQGPSIIPWKKS
jgi:hypothetical protein